ncbi:hypothetical protein Pcinc_040750 [Petrolisthes cinctipes]|uniref:Annexin n=1 Tax=Petrolisthes cinctipes TaxID=88211 RepID=A0AAE1EJ54_PETCI|nr:hypothetical protein Pcinc_040750 [Petrolisthes cinctipes]
MGTDEAAIIKVLVGCSSNQRQIIHQHYDNTFSKDLIKDLKKELRGNFEDVILALLRPRVEYLSMELHQALEHKRGQVLVEILCTHDNATIKAIKSSYNKEHDDGMEEDLRKKLSGVFEAVMVGMSAAVRSDYFNPDDSKIIAQKLYNGGNGLVTGELVTAFSTLSFKQLHGVFVNYYQEAGRTLGETLEHEYKGDERNNLKHVFKCLQNRAAFFAESIHSSLAGMGTKDNDLIRLIVSRSEVDLGDIKNEYLTLYSKTLEADIKADTSGDYKKVLLAILDPN